MHNIWGKQLCCNSGIRMSPRHRMQLQCCQCGFLPESLSHMFWSKLPNQTMDCKLGRLCWHCNSEFRSRSAVHCMLSLCCRYGFLSECLLRMSSSKFPKQTNHYKLGRQCWHCNSEFRSRSAVHCTLLLCCQCGFLSECLWRMSSSKL